MKTTHIIATFMLSSGMLPLSGCGEGGTVAARNTEEAAPHSLTEVTREVSTASLLWDGDAAKGASEVWKVLNIEGEGTIGVASDGTYGPVWEFYKPSGSHRTEGHGAKGFQAQEGSDIYLGWRSHLAMPATLSTNAIFQWKAYGDTEPMTQNFPIILSTASGVLHLLHYAPGKIGTELWQTPLTTNTWNTFVLRIKVSRDAATGFMEFWYNGVKQTLINGSTRYYGRTLDAGYCDPKWGVYGGDSGSVTHLVQALRIASTYAEAAPAGTGNGGGGGDQKVTLFQNCNYGGWSASFGVGSYQIADLEAQGGINDDASSIKIPSGLKVTLYENNNFSGASTVLTADDSCLKDNDFNDKVSSFVVSAD